MVMELVMLDSKDFSQKQRDKLMLYS